jgi:hypothetical protein
MLFTACIILPAIHRSIARYTVSTKKAIGTTDTPISGNSTALQRHFLGQRHALMKSPRENHVTYSTKLHLSSNFTIGNPLNGGDRGTISKVANHK